MAEAGAGVWWIQADADRRAARRVFDLADERTYCQAVAKQQQAVEKSVKALAAAVRDARLASVRIKFTHEVDKLLNALNRLHPPTGENAVIQSRIHQLISTRWEKEIGDLMALAPKALAEGEMLLARNTEYPYQNADGSWRAPAESGSFSDADVRRFQALADHIVFGTERLISAIERRP
jgi:HEPN domain-containing protein